MATRTDSHLQPLDVALVRAPRKDTQDTMARVTAEFREMPGLSVTLAQAARLFNMPREECSGLFDELQRQGVIEVTSNGLYRRPSGE